MACATSNKAPAFDSNPLSTASAAKLEARAAASKIQCNTDAAEPIVRIPSYFPPRAIRTGQTRFVFDLDDVGTPTNVRIVHATEEVFVQPTLRSLKKWKYAEKRPGEPESKRKNLCSVMTFRLQDERGRIIPTWDDIVAKNEAYRKYKAAQ